MTIARMKRIAAALIAVASIAGLNTNESLAQCASGSCGSVGVADGYGGFGTVPFGGAGLAGSAVARSGSAWGNRHVQPLFDNYFTQGNANGADAALYISPVGVPGWVGHTYNTYQPLYPDEYLYHHKDRYHSYYDNGFGMNRTKASYYSPPARTALQRVHRKLEIPR